MEIYINNEKITPSKTLSHKEVLEFKGDYTHTFKIKINKENKKLWERLFKQES